MNGFENIKERVELREKFRLETGHNWENPQGEPDVEYVLWLESKLLAIPSIVGRSEHLFCPHCEGISIQENFYTSTCACNSCGHSWSK